jgi:hypothetical protein
VWQDPIVEETRALREAYAAQFQHDPAAIFNDILRRQAEPGKTLVRFPPRKPSAEPLPRPTIATRTSDARKNRGLNEKVKE